MFVARARQYFALALGFSVQAACSFRLAPIVGDKPGGPQLLITVNGVGSLFLRLAVSHDRCRTRWQNSQHVWVRCRSVHEMHRQGTPRLSGVILQ